MLAARNCPGGGADRRSRPAHQLLLERASSGTRRPVRHRQGARTEPAVVTEQLGVTDYRKRLDQLVSKNPFRRHFMALPKSAKLTTTSSSSATSSTATGGPRARAAVVLVDSGGSVSGQLHGIPVDHVHDRPPGPDRATRTAPLRETGSPTLVFVPDLGGGGSGRRPDRARNVKRTAYLPGKNRPLVSFIGVSEDAKHAIFAVSERRELGPRRRSVLPQARRNCNFLQLKPGDKAEPRLRAGERSHLQPEAAADQARPDLEVSRRRLAQDRPRSRCSAPTAEPTRRAHRLQEPRSTSLGLAA